MPQAKRYWFRSKPQKQDHKPSRHRGSPDDQAGNAPPAANSSDSVPPIGKPAKKARAFTARKMFAVTAIAATAILTAVLMAASNQKHLQPPTSITHSSSSTSETKQNSTSSNFPSGCWAAVSDHRFTPDKENFPVWDIYERDSTDEAANMALRLCRRGSPAPSTCHVLQVGCN
jgi:hypothetical protein